MARVSKRRLFGIDRSGPDPGATRAGEPLRPLTLPNLIGYARLAAIPVFFVIALGSEDGRDTTAALIYFAIAMGDYVDGLVARATGQYSRMGALLDPVVDRLTVLAGIIVCWHFELLPRWALLVLAAREVVTLIVARVGLKRGVDIEINWVGRIGVALVLASLFWAQVIDSVVCDLALVLGLVFSIGATLLYIQRGLRGPLQPSTSG